MRLGGHTPHQHLDRPTLDGDAIECARCGRILDPVTVQRKADRREKRERGRRSLRSQGIDPHRSNG